MEFRYLFIVVIYLFTLCNYAKKTPEYIEEIIALENTRNILTKSKKINTDQLLELNESLANKYLDHGYYHKGVLVIKENIQLLKSSKKDNWAKHATNHLMLANFYDRIGFIEKFKNHTIHFYFYFKKAYPNKKIYQCLYLSYLSRYYNYRMELKKGIELSEQSIAVLEKNKKDAHLIDEVMVLTNHSFSLRNKEHAKITERKNLALKINNLLQKNEKTYRTNTSYHLIASQMYILDTAANYFIKTNKSFEPFNNPFAKDLTKKLTTEKNKIIQYSNTHHPLAARYNLLIGLLYYYQNDWNTAISHYDQAISQFTLSSFNDADFISPNNNLLTAAYLWKSWCYSNKYEVTADIKYLHENEKLYQKLELVWRLYVSDVIDSENNFVNYEYISNPYSFIQKNYLKLLKATNDKKYYEKIYQTGNLSRHFSFVFLKSKKYEANNEKFYRMIEDYFLKSYTSQKSSVKHIDEELNKIKKNLLLKSIYPNNYEKIKKSLPENEALIIYSNYEKEKEHYLITHVIKQNKDTILLSELGDHYRFNTYEKSDTIIKTLYANNIDEFKNTSYQYYNTLLQPIIPFLGKKINSLKVVKSNYLENLHIPFDLLLTNKEESQTFKNLSYIGNNIHFTYPFNISQFLNENSTVKTPITIFISENEKLSPFIHTNEFVKNIQSKFDVDVISGKLATKKALIKTLNTKKFVIVISHGKGSVIENKEDSGIFLTDGFLSVKEIYQLKIPNSIVVLNGCSIGNGYRSLEGNINAIRAFNFAGAKTILSSNWDIDEKSSLSILELWLDNLSQGHTISESLKIAQNNYLNKTNARLSNPLYWAPFRVNGSDGKVQLKSTTNYLAWTTISTGFVILFFLIRWKKSKKRSLKTH